PFDEVRRLGHTGDLGGLDDLLDAHDVECELAITNDECDHLRRIAGHVPRGGRAGAGPLATGGQARAHVAPWARRRRASWKSTTAARLSRITIRSVRPRPIPARKSRSAAARVAGGGSMSLSPKRTTPRTASTKRPKRSGPRTTTRMRALDPGGT